MIPAFVQLFILVYVVSLWTDIARFFTDKRSRRPTRIILIVLYGTTAILMGAHLLGFQLMLPFRLFIDFIAPWVITMIGRLT